MGTSLLGSGHIVVFFLPSLLLILRDDFFQTFNILVCHFYLLCNLFGITFIQILIPINYITVPSTMSNISFSKGNDSSAGFFLKGL